MTFHVGHRVLRQTHYLSKEDKFFNAKLAEPFEGPWLIRIKISDVKYEVLDITDNTRHQLHVSDLKSLKEVKKSIILNGARGQEQANHERKASKEIIPLDVRCRLELRYQEKCLRTKSLYQREFDYRNRINESLNNENRKMAKQRRDQEPEKTTDDFSEDSEEEILPKEDQKRRSPELKWQPRCLRKYVGKRDSTEAEQNRSPKSGVGGDNQLHH